MSWITITEADVLTRLTGPELSAMKSAALAVGQSNPLPEIITQVIDEMRGYIAACQNNTLGAGETIPSKLLGTALAMIRYRLANRLPVKSLLDENRVDENKQAIDLLRQVAACKFLVEEPTEKSDEILPAPKPSMKKRHHRFGRRHEEGI